MTRVSGEGAPDEPAATAPQRRGPRRGSGTRLEDVARLANVSSMTVSNVLHGRVGFTEETRDRVLAAARELNYKPNRSAQRLRSNRSHQLGLHLPAELISVREPFSVSFLRSVSLAAEGAGQQLVVFASELSEKSVRGLVQAGVDGFVLSAVGEDDPRPHIFTDLGVPFAIMGRLDRHLPQHSVDVDNIAAMAAVVDHLVDRGHREFAYVGYPSPFYAESERAVATVARLREHGLTIADDRLVRVDLPSIGAQVTRQLLDAPTRPDAVICSSDVIAIQVHAALREAGLRPGLDIAVTGFDALELPFDLDPPLTSVRLPIDTVATELVDLLLRLIDGAPSPEHGLIVQTELVVGETSWADPGPSAPVARGGCPGRYTFVTRNR